MVYGAGTRLVGNPSSNAGDGATRPIYGDGQSSPNYGLRLSWLHPMGMIALSFVNFFLRIVTIGIYHFWGKTEVRRRIWSAIRIDGEPLEYTGLGKELFFGFLIVFAVLLLPLMLGAFAVTIAFGPQSPAIAIFQVLVYVALIYLVGVGMYRAQRYRMSRTRWRGIRGAVAGNSWSYGWTYFWTALLIPLTLGWIAPWRSTKLQKLLTDDTRFGNRPFRFNAPSGPLYSRFVVLWLGALVIAALVSAGMYAITMYEMQGMMDSADAEPKMSSEGITMMILLFLVAYLLYAIASAWYRAGMFNHFARHTHFEGASFAGNVTAGGLIWLAVSNFFITVLSLGLLTPVAQARTARYLVEHLQITGTVPFAEIAQSLQAESKMGEGLAQAFDVDAF